MDTDGAVKAIQARFNDNSPEFKTIVDDTLVLGVERVCQEIQWKFLDKYAVLTTKVSTVDAVGKTRFVLAPDFFKEVVIWTDNQVVEHDNQVNWARRQMNNASAGEPRFYSIIGEELVISEPADTSALYWIYTRKSGGRKIEDIPEHLHYASVAATVAFLAPSYVSVGERRVQNQDLMFAERAYLSAVAHAMKVESRQRGRRREILPSYEIALRNEYT